MQNLLLTSDDVAEIIGVCLAEPGLHGRRDAALFAVCWCGQLSMPEAVRVDVDAAKRLICPCGGPFAEALNQWLALRPDVPGRLLLSINRRGKIIAEPMPATTASEIVRRRTAEARKGYVTPQSLLRSSVLAARRGEASGWCATDG